MLSILWTNFYTSLYDNFSLHIIIVEIERNLLTYYFDFTLILLLFECFSNSSFSEYFINFNSFPIWIERIAIQNGIYATYRIASASATNSYEFFNNFRFQTRIEKYLVYEI